MPSKSWSRRGCKNVSCKESQKEISMIKIMQMLIVGLLFISNLYGQELEGYKWKKRILIIETPDKTNVKYTSQINELVNLEKDLLDRKLVITEIVENKYKTTNYSLEQNDEEWKKLDGRGVLSRNKIEDFKVILIGLDGNIKLEKREILRKEELFEIIDSMPMRISELRNKIKPNDKRK
jgi:hypothetical protein